MVNPVETDVRAAIDLDGLDALGRARASIAIALAARLDASAGSTSGAVAQSVAPVARELRAILAEIAAEQMGDDPLLRSLLADA